MQKFKKFVSSVVAFSIAASVFATVSFASVSADVKGTEYESEANVLGALNIMVGDADTGNFRPEDPIKRSEVTKVGVAIMGLSSSAGSSQNNASRYPDMGPAHWANGFVNIATAQGLVIGDDTGSFRPDDQIKYSEAVAILVRALGYEPQADSKGGYPSGYVATASSIGLTKGVKGTADTLIKRGDVARLAYNALTIKLMEQTNFGSNPSYEIVDKTLLKDKLDVELVSGRVEAVGSSVLNGGSALEKDEIQIGEKIYKVGNADVRTVLGFEVDAYISDASGKKQQKVLTLVPAEGKNNVVTVGASDIEKIVNEDGTKELHYRADKESSKISKLNVDPEAYIMYNGKASTFDKFTQIKSGSIILLDSNSNKKYDVVFINETSNYVVDSVYPSSNKITDKYNNGTLELDFEDDNKTIILEKGNELIDLKALKEWDVITLTVSEDKELIYGNVSENPVTGKISEADSEYVYIGSEKYEIASNYPYSLELGTEGTFYLDFDGKIAAFDGKSAKSSNYAYLEDLSVSTGMDKTLKLKLFTKDGKLEVLNSADKIKVNQNSGLTPEKALAAIGEKGQVITFETNSKGLVTRINTSTKSSEIDEKSFIMNLKEDGVEYKSASSKLLGSEMNITVGADTVIFDIPSGGSTSDYAIRDKGIFADGGRYDITVYDVTENYKAGVIVVTNSESKTDEASEIAIISKITTSSDENGDTVYKIYAFSGGKEINLIAEDDALIKKADGSKLALGDIIQFRASSSGKLDAVKLLLDIKTKDTEARNEISENLTTVYGRIIKKFSGSVNVQVGDGKAENYTVADAKIYVYDSKLTKNNITVGDESDLQSYENDGGRVFMRIYKDEVKEIVVVK